MKLILLLSAIVYFATIFRGNFDSISRRFLITYAGVWFVALSLSEYGVGDMNIPSDSTVTLLIVHLYSFLLGFRLINKCSLYCTPFSDSLESSIVILLNSKVFRVLFMLCFLYVLSMFAVFFRTVMALQSLADVRTEFYEGDLYGSLYGMINMFILTPLDYILFPLFGYMCVKKRNWLWVMIMFYLLIHNSLAGGRLGYIRILLGIVFFVYCLSKSTIGDRNIKQYLTVIMAGVLVYGLVIITSAGRNGILGFSAQTLTDGQEIANEHLTSYTSGPIAAFDYALNHNYETMVGGYKHGGLIFTTIEGLFYTIVGRIGITYERPITSVVILLQDSQIDLGGTCTLWNALYTSCIYYYLDFGKWGVIIIPFFIGLLFRYAIKKYYIEHNVYTFILLGFVFLKLIFSIIQYNFTNFSELLFVFFLIYMSRKKQVVSRI